MVKRWRGHSRSSVAGPSDKRQALGVSLPIGTEQAHTCEMVIQILQSSRSSRVRRRPVVLASIVLAFFVALILAAFTVMVGWPD